MMKAFIFLVASVECLSLVKSYKMDQDALLRVFEPYLVDDKVSPQAINEAYAATDKYGQPLPLPPQKILMQQADTNKDGSLSVEELQGWKGYEGKAYCRNPGDSMYGCLARCSNGIDRLDGDPGFFEKYSVESKDYPEDGDVQLRVNQKYTGGFTKAQRLAIKRAINATVKDKVEGAFVELGEKDSHSWRMLYDTLTAAGDKTREIHLYDSFTGFAQCDHKKDTGMCPAVGTSAPNMEALRSDIREYGDTSRVKIHKVGFHNIPKAEFPSKISLVLIDGALYPTVLDMLQSIYPMLAPGATIFIHDFGWEGYPGVERAVHDFLMNTGRGLRAVLPGSPDGVACYLAQINV